MLGNRKVYAVILAAGSGKRMQSSEKKQFLEFNGKPLFYYSFEKFSLHPSVDGVMLVTAEEDIPHMKELLMTSVDESNEDRAVIMDKFKGYVSGGKERYHSVANALKYLKQGLKDAGITEDPIVLIHDAARPFIDASVIDRVLSKASADAVIPAVPVKDTIRVVNKYQEVTATPARSTLIAVQTPQGFPFSMLYHAYEELEKEEESGALHLEITDDAMVAEHYAGTKIKVVEGSYNNMKITTPEDVLLAELNFR